MSIEFRDQHGRKVSQHQWLRGLQDDVVDEVDKALEAQIRSVRCPEHRQTVRQLRARRESDGLQYTWEACCEKLNEAVERKLFVPVRGGKNAPP